MGNSSNDLLKHSDYLDLYENVINAFGKFCLGNYMLFAVKNKALNSESWILLETSKLNVYWCKCLAQLPVEVY